MGSSNPGALLNPKNLVPALLTGGISYGLESVRKGMKPPPIPQPGALPVPTPTPTATDQNPYQSQLARQKKLASLQLGFASTVSKKPSLAAANPNGLKPLLGS